MIQPHMISILFLSLVHKAISRELCPHLRIFACIIYIILYWFACLLFFCLFQLSRSISIATWDILARSVRNKVLLEPSCMYSRFFFIGIGVGHPPSSNLFITILVQIDET